MVHKVLRMQLLLSLLCVMGATAKQILIYQEQSLNWFDAQAYCRQHHMDLVTIRDDVDNGKIVRDGWLGLYRDNSYSHWKWSKGDEANNFAVSWVGDDPDFGEDCVKKEPRDEGKWRTKFCHEQYNFYCVDETLSLVKERKTWEEALAHCRAMEVISPAAYNNHSCDLASLVTIEDQYYAAEVTQTAETDQVWTGLRFLGDQWMWVGGEDGYYGDINSCPAVNHCAALDKNSLELNIRQCDERKNFLCTNRPAAV